MARLRVVRIVGALFVAVVVGVSMGCVAQSAEARISALPTAASDPFFSAASSSSSSNGPCAQCRELPGPERGECMRACLAGVGSFCGGIAGIPCPTGLTCVLDGDYPDAGGVCRPH